MLCAAEKIILDIDNSRGTAVIVGDGVGKNRIKQAAYIRLLHTLYKQLLAKIFTHACRRKIQQVSAGNKIVTSSP